MRSLSTILFSLLLLIPFTLSQTVVNINSTLNSAVFVYNTTGDGFVFALNANSNGDLYFHMSAPAGNAWMGVGIGSEMANSLMFIVYPTSNGSNITLSPRVGLNGNSEPTYDSSIVCDLISNSNLADANTITSYGYQGLEGNMIVDAVCHNATSWTGSGNSIHSIDLTSTQQPFIFAVGPDESINSDALDAPLNRHSFYGQFTMDMVQATTKTGSGGVPLPDSANGTYVLSGASNAYDLVGDNNLIPAVHAVFMLLAFVIIFPIGALTLRVLRRVLFHAAVQLLGVLFIIVGFGTGINISSQYNRSRNYNSAHQIIGLLLFAAVLIDFGLGLSAHLIFKRTQKYPSTRIAHMILGPTSIILGVINGGLGFKLAINDDYNTDYIIVVVAVAVLFIGVRGTIFCCNSDRKEAREDAAALVAAANRAPEHSAGTYYRFDNAAGQYVPMYVGEGEEHGTQLDAEGRPKQPAVTTTTREQGTVGDVDGQPAQVPPPSYRDSVYRRQSQQQQVSRQEEFQMQTFSSAQVQAQAQAYNQQQQQQQYQQYQQYQQSQQQQHHQQIQQQHQMYYPPPGATQS